MKRKHNINIRNLIRKKEIEITLEMFLCRFILQSPPICFLDDESMRERPI